MKSQEISSRRGPIAAELCDSHKHPCGLLSCARFTVTKLVSVVCSGRHFTIHDCLFCYKLGRSWFILQGDMSATVDRREKVKPVLVCLDGIWLVHCLYVSTV